MFHSPQLVALAEFAVLFLEFALRFRYGWGLGEWTSILIVDGYYRVPLRRQVRINWKLG